MYERKFNGESTEQIALWLQDSHNLNISSRQLWRIFKSTIPDFVMEAVKQHKNILTEDEKTLDQIRELEKVAEMQLERIRAQRWDEMDQEGIARTNLQTGEVEYSATNKNLNDSLRTYNGLIKSILEMKSAVGLVRKQAEVIEVKTSMNTITRQALTGMIQNALRTDPSLNKFIQEGTEEAVEVEYTEVESNEIDMESPERAEIENN